MNNMIKRAIRNVSLSTISAMDTHCFLSQIIEIENLDRWALESEVTSSRKGTGNCNYFVLSFHCACLCLRVTFVEGLEACLYISNFFKSLFNIGPTLKQENQSTNASTGEATPKSVDLDLLDSLVSTPI